MYYDILDFEAIVKHSYFACSGNDDKLYCDETGQEVIKWESGANALLSIYIEHLDSLRNTVAAMDMGIDYRRAIFPEYKAHRKKNQESRSPLVGEQINKLLDWAKQFFSAAGITMIGVDGVEADDVIAWICAGEDVHGVIHTVDEDLLQLVSPNIAVNLKRVMYYEGENYKDHPTNIMAVKKSLLGDKSDGYKGVPQFGPKAFDTLVDAVGYDGIKMLGEIAETRNLKALQDAVESWEGELKPLNLILNNFSEWTKQWRLAKRHPELCWKPRRGKLTKPVIHKRVPNKDRVLRLLEMVGAADFLEYIPTPEFLAVDETNWDEEIGKIKQKIDEGDIVSFDYETTDFAKVASFQEARTNFVDVYNQDITGVSFCFGRDLETTIYVPVDHKDADNVDIKRVGELLDYIQSSGKRLVAQNFFFEGVVTRRNLGMTLENVWDTRIMQRYFDENSSASLKDMSRQYLGYLQASYEETTQGRDMADLTLEEVFQYGIDDSLVTAHLCDLLQLLLRLDGQWKHYEKWAVQPTQLLQDMFVEGVTINWKRQHEIHQEDLQIRSQSIEKLRVLLQKNVTGEVTDGCKSFLEVENDFIQKSFRNRFGDEWRTKYYEWRGAKERACTYLPYSEEEVMPNFAYTPLQLTAAATAVGLPPVEKVTLKFLSNYFDELGVTSTDDVDLTEGQEEFIDALRNAVAQRVDKLKSDPTYLRQEAFDRLAEVCQRLAGTKPRIIKQGDELNLGSSAQMQELLYCKLGMPVRLHGDAGKTRQAVGVRKGAPSTDEDSIKTALALDVTEGMWQKEALELLLRAKSAHTRITLFHNKMPLWAHSDGKVRPYIIDSGTDTRRPTGSNPNLLQTPSRGEGYKMRQMYVPPTKDHLCVAIDYSGQELRITASESGDPVMIAAYEPGNEKDLHSMTATGIVKLKDPGSILVDFDEFVKVRKDRGHELHDEVVELRENAKGVNFLMAYLGGYHALSRDLIVTEEEAEDMLNGAFALYERMLPWQEETSNFMKNNGFTITAFGTKRHATDNIFSRSKSVVSSELRTGVNATIQGAAAEMLKIVMTKMVDSKELSNLDYHFFAGIYDETVSWVHKDDVGEYWKNMKEIMESATPPGHAVPQVPELSIGHNWGDLVELGRNPSHEDIQKVIDECLEKAEEIWETDMKVTHEDIYGKGA